MADHPTSTARGGRPTLTKADVLTALGLQDRDEEITKSELDNLLYEKASTTREGRPTLTRAEVVAALELQDQHEEITKLELDNLLYEKAGLIVSEDILSSIFLECDSDNSGRVSIDELVDYVNRIERPTNSELSRKAVWETVCSVSFPPLVAFFTAIFVNLTVGLIDIVGGGYESSFNIYGFTSVLFFFGFLLYSVLVYNAIREEVDLVERASAKVVLWAQNGFRAKGTDDSPALVFGPHAEWTLADLKRALEESAVFLPYHTLLKVFNLIDADNSGMISCAEIMEYADAHAKRRDRQGETRSRLIWHECFRSLDFWASCGWVVGCIAYIFGNYGVNFSQDTVTALNGTGAIFFTIPSIVMFRSYFRSVNSTLDYAQELNVLLRSLAVRAFQSSYRAEAASGDSAEHVIDPSSVDLRTAAEALFADIDSHGENARDQTLDFIELYDYLSKAGFVIQLDILRSLFNQADKNCDGSLQFNEFVDYIERVGTDVSIFDRARDLLNVVIREIYFYALLIQLAGGVLLIVGNFATTLDEVDRFSLTVCVFTSWLIPVLYYASVLFDSNGKRLRALAFSRAKFRADILKAVRNDDTEGQVASGGFSDDYQKKFADSAFSFIVATKWFSAPFNTALTVVSIECAVLALIVWGLLTGDPSNPLGIPPAVEAPVLVAQILALLIAVFTQSDLVNGASLLVEGYHQESVEATFQEASSDKWLLSCILMLLVGSFTLSSVFLLVVTSTDVVELMLNFTALEFVSLLDNVAYFLSRRGFLGKLNEDIAMQIQDTSFKSPISKGRRTGMKLTLLLLSGAGLLSAWTAIYARQLQGHFFPQTVIAQFDDAVDMNLGTYSGLYVLQIRRLNFGFNRIRYIGEEGVGMFAYCTSERAWTFSVKPDSDPCEKYIAISTESVDFDITNTNSEGWLATSDPELQRYYPMERFFIGLPCEENVECGGAGRGVCDDKERCGCNPPYYGWRCDFDERATCDVMDVDLILGSSFEIVDRVFAQRFYMLRKANGDLFSLYHRPVFASNMDGAASGDLIMFTGLRWALFRIPLELNIRNHDELLAFLEDDFILNRKVEQFLGARQYFFSDPVWFNTPTERATPIGVTWNFALRSADTLADALTTGRRDTVLFCAKCNNKTNTCANDGFCPSSGFCECRHGASGTLCRITPVSNAVCNSEYFNSDVFGWDGGDCCEYSCVDTEENACGIIYHVSEAVDVQFPNCSDPKAFCTPDQTGGQCWRRTSRPLLPTESTSLNLSLSANGKLLIRAVTQGVNVWDKVDSRWLQRGKTITDVRGSRFGERVAIFTPISEVQGKIDGSGVNAFVVVGLYRTGLAGARVFSWDTDGLSWFQIGPEVSFCTSVCSLKHLAIGKYKSTLSVAARIDGGSVLLFALPLGDVTAGSWQLVQSLPGNYTSLSGNGQVLAVVSDALVMIYSILGSASNQTLQILNEGVVEELGSALTEIQAMELSFDGRELSFVVLNKAGDDFVITLKTMIPIPFQRLNKQSIGPLSRRALRAGFNPTSISTDGSGLGVVIAGEYGRPKIGTYRFKRSLGWIRVDAVYWNEGFTIDNRFSVSSGASIVAVEGRSLVNTSTVYPSCPDGSKKFRLSLPLRAALGKVSWSLSSYVVIGNKRVVTNSVREVCDHCYEDVEDDSLISVEGCALKEECFELKYQELDEMEEKQYFFFFEDDSLLWSGIGNTSEQLQLLGEDCQGRIQGANCTQGLSWFQLVLNLDQVRQDTSWRLEDEDKAVLLSGGGGEYQASNGSVYFHSSCIPATSHCLSFVMLDSFGDGMCCDLGEGSYSLFLDGKEIISRKGDQFDFGERIEFGTCETRVVPPQNISVIVFPDPNPWQISWYLEDGSGYRFGDSSSTSVNMTAGLRLFSKIDDYLYFTIEDSGGDGFSGYSLNYNGVEFVSETTSGYGERVQLARNSSNYTSVTPLVKLSLYMELDSEPNETGWTLTDVANGREIGGAKIGTYNDTTNAAMAVNEQFLVLSGGSYELTILDAGGDGLFSYETNRTYVSVLLNDQPFFRDDSAFASNISYAIIVPTRSFLLRY